MPQELTIVYFGSAFIADVDLIGIFTFIFIFDSGFREQKDLRQKERSSM